MSSLLQFIPRHRPTAVTPSRNGMAAKGHAPLRERATRAWQKERPRRVAQLVRRARLSLELRKKIKEVLGEDLPMRIITDPQDRPVAIIEEFRFTLSEQHDGEYKGLILIDTCPRCEAETGYTINTIADLGQLIEGFGITIRSSCTECIGLTDDDLKLTASPHCNNRRRITRTG